MEKLCIVVVLASDMFRERADTCSRSPRDKHGDIRWQTERMRITIPSLSVNGTKSSFSFSSQAGEVDSRMFGANITVVRI